MASALIYLLDLREGRVWLRFFWNNVVNPFVFLGSFLLGLFISMDCMRDSMPIFSIPILILCVKWPVIIFMLHVYLVFCIHLYFVR